MEPFDSFATILRRGHTRAVITGDSLSYNRYDFDPVHRLDAWDCFPGMPSWPFLLREAIWQEDGAFVFGDQLSVSGAPVVFGAAAYPDAPSPYAVLLGGRVCAAICAQNDAFSFDVQAHGGMLCLYLQRRPDGRSARFDICVDGRPALRGIDTASDPARFQGWEPMVVRVPACGDGTHRVSIENVRPEGAESAYITLLGAGPRAAEVELTGRGGMQASFFVENFEERIGRYTPDVLVLIIGANDRAYITPDAFRHHLRTLLSMVRTRLPDCHILLLGPPSSRVSGQTEELPVYCSDAYSAAFIDALREAADEFDAVFLDLISLFAELPLAQWRFDNVHFTKQGNTMLLHRVLNILLPDGRYDPALADSARAIRES